MRLKQWDVEVNLTIFYQYDNWLLDVILAFGPWVGLGLSRPYQTWVFYKIGWVFYKFAENWSIQKGGNLPAIWVIETPVRAPIALLHIYMIWWRQQHCVCEKWVPFFWNSQSTGREMIGSTVQASSTQRWSRNLFSLLPKTTLWVQIMARTHLLIIFVTKYSRHSFSHYVTAYCQVLMCGPPPMINFACIPNLDKLGYSQHQRFSY